MVIQLSDVTAGSSYGVAAIGSNCRKWLWWLSSEVTAESDYGGSAIGS